MKEQNSPYGGLGMWFFALGSLLTDFLLLGFVGYLAVVVRWDFQRVFQDLGVELPAPTAAFLAVPDGAFITLLVSIGILLAAKEVALASRPFKVSLNIAVGVALLAFATVLYLSLLIPTIGLVQSLP